jgi:4-amino-4-deoxy-L-arabinose transferase-like glycosyltransferase
MSKKEKIYLAAIMAAALILRLFFLNGHIYSDDSYYSHLSYTILTGNFAEHYFGYPIFLLRLLHLYLTSFSFFLFGINPFASVIFPLLFSLLNILLCFLLSKELTGNTTTALISSFFFSILPTDIFFATINFTDLQASFIIYLSLYLLLISIKKNKLSYALLSSLIFSLSLQMKETGLFFLPALLLIFLYLLFVKKQFEYKLLLPGVFIFLNIFIEGLIYLIINNDFFYRFALLQRNYLYAYYDFFPYTTGANTIWKVAIHQVFISNPYWLFLRRYYLFLPLTGFIYSIYSIVKKKQLLLPFWTVAVSLALIGFSLSLFEYRPLSLKSSWYAYPVFIPAIILTAQLINTLRNTIKIPLLILYLFFSIFMCRQYYFFFDSPNLKQFNNFIKENSGKQIYSDHFTYYGINLITGYKTYNPDNIINKQSFNTEQISSGDLFILHTDHIKELSLQGYKFPHISDSSYNLINNIGYFSIYQKQ